MERLTKRTEKGKVTLSNCTVSLRNALDKLSAYEDAEEQGLLLRLPVRCGEWVYSAECGYVKPYIVASFSADKYGLWCLNLHGGLIGLWGETVFLTRAEAEKALEDMEKRI